jgi:hypothetical protein
MWRQLMTWFVFSDPACLVMLSEEAQCQALEALSMTEHQS